MRSLGWRLALGFALTVVVAVGLTGLLARASTAQRFEVLISEAGRTRAEALAPLLAAEYQYWGDWKALAEQRVLRATAGLSPPVEFFFPHMAQNHRQGMELPEIPLDLQNDWGELALEAVGVHRGSVKENWQTGQSLIEAAAAGGQDADRMAQVIIDAEAEAVVNAVRIGEIEETDAQLYLDNLASRVQVYLNTTRVQRDGSRLWLVSPPQLTVEGSNWLVEELLFGDERLLVADESGRVVIDSYGEMTGEPLGEAALAAGASVVVDGQRVGTVLVGAELGLYDAQQRAFLDGVSTSVGLSAALAGVAALVTGVMIARYVARPARDLTTAAERIAAGDWDQRVPVRSHDELGQMSRAFNRMAQEISAQRMLRSRLVDDIAHELNTPLSLMQLEIQAMEDGLQPPEEAALHLRCEVAQLHELASDLAYLADADAGAPALDLAPAEVNELVKRVSERFTGHGAAAGVELEVKLCEGAPMLSLDRARIERALSNLLSNALRHTRAGGCIWVTTARENDAVTVTVRDTGEGIPEDDLPHVWERLYRADRSRSRDTGGRGLGLAIVRQAVELHGGRVWAESTVGVGSTFGFALPL